MKSDARGKRQPNKIERKVCFFRFTRVHKNGNRQPNEERVRESKSRLDGVRVRAQWIVFTRIYKKWNSEACSKYESKFNMRKCWRGKPEALQFYWMPRWIMTIIKSHSSVLLKIINVPYFIIAKINSRDPATFQQMFFTD